MENNAPPNFVPNSIPSSQFRPGSTGTVQNHINQHGTPPPIASYGLKQNVDSNSPKPQALQNGPYSNNFGPHSSNSPAFNQPGIQPTLMPQLNTQVMLTQAQFPSPGPQNISPQYGPSPTGASARPAMSNIGAVSNPISSYNQYPSNTGSGNPGLRSMAPVQQWSQPFPTNTSTPSSRPIQNFSSGSPVVNGPLGMTNAASSGVSTGLRPNIPPPATSQYVSPLPSTVPPVNSVNIASYSRPQQTNYSNITTSQPLQRPPGTFGGSMGSPQMQQSLQAPSSSAQNGPPMGTFGPLSGLSRVPRPPGPLDPSGGHVRPLGAQTFGSQVEIPSGGLSGNAQNIGPPQSAPSLGSHQIRPQSSLHGPQNGIHAPQVSMPSAPQNYQSVPAAALPSGYQQAPPSGLISGPSSTMHSSSGQSSMNSRYPQSVLPQPNYQSQPNLQAYPKSSAPQTMQNLTNQTAQMSVTQSGFNQLWGQQMYDLMQTRHILPEYPEEPPEIKLGHQFSESSNCSPEIFRCTINKIPETNALLQKSRLPLGILIHPFKDLHHLPVIQCSAIVRCRSCRTYINPFVYFVDSKRWKCNLCYRVNDLPDEFQYDPMSKSYGDPTRRPEIKSATIEFIAPGEYMLRPPQPAVYLFLLDVSDIACESGYLQVFCETLKSNLDQLPGDARTQVGFICYDANIHFYLLGEGLTRPREMTVLDIDDIFIPSPEYLLVNLGERREMIEDLLDSLPRRHTEHRIRERSSALGAALQAAFKLMAPTGGRVTVMQTCLPNIGPGALTSREDPNARASKDVAHLNPATDFYKRLALECSGAQVAVDLFLVSSQYADLATLSGISKFSGGTVYYLPVFNAQRAWQADTLRRMLNRYLSRKIGFEAVMRIRCTRGITIHAFHGNFFVRSTDLLSLPNVSPDAGFGMQLAIEESLSDLQQVCFQAAVLYTSSKGERRIRVHTLCLPVASNLTDVLHAADQQCIIGLLTKMAVDRAQQSTLSDAREALSNVAVDTLSAHRLAQNLAAGAGGALLAPASLRLLCLYLSALLKHLAFRVGTSTRLDDRVAAMCAMKSAPLPLLMQSVYPDLYPVHTLHHYMDNSEEEPFPHPPRMHLSAERINSDGVYLLDDGEQMIIYVCSGVCPEFLYDVLGVSSFAEVVDEARELPTLDNRNNELIHEFIDRLNDDRPYAAQILVLRDDSPSRKLFTDRLVDDRMDSTFSYYEFLQHVKSLMK